MDHDHAIIPPDDEGPHDLGEEEDQATHDDEENEMDDTDDESREANARTAQSRDLYEQPDQPDGRPGSDLTGGPVIGGGNAPFFDAVAEGSEGGADEGEGSQPPESDPPNLPKASS